MELGLKWAANPNILVAVKAFGLRATVQVISHGNYVHFSHVFSLITVTCLTLENIHLFQVLDLQVFALPRITLKPLVPVFPCFANIHVSLMEKVRIDRFTSIRDNSLGNY